MSKNRGFTLIETLIYSALVTGLVTVAILATYQMIDARQRGKNLAELADSHRLLEQKIYWALQSVSALNSPGVGATTTSLSVDKIGYGNNPVVLDLDGGAARIKLGIGAAVPITNYHHVEVQDLFFHHYDFSGQPGIQVSATLFNAFTSTTVAIDTTIILELP